MRMFEWFQCSFKKGRNSFSISYSDQKCRCEGHSHRDGIKDINCKDLINMHSLIPTRKGNNLAVITDGNILIPLIICKNI